MAANKRPRMYPTPEVRRGAHVTPRRCERVTLRQMAIAAGFQPKTQDAVVIVDGATFG